MFGIQGIRVSDFIPPPKVVLLIFYSGRLSNLGQQGVIGGGEAGKRDNGANEAASKLFKSNLLDILF